jgi:hypothetical protein
LADITTSLALVGHDWHLLEQGMQGEQMENFKIIMHLWIIRTDSKAIHINAIARHRRQPNRRSGTL